MNKLALITGASRGIGRAIAIQLAKDGYDIIAHYNKSKVDIDSLEDEIESIGRNCKVISADLSKDTQVEKMFSEITKEFKQLDLLVNNAGADHAKLFEESTLDELRNTIDIILWSKIIVTKYALPLLKTKQNSSIINISSRLGKEKTIKGVSAYGPSQAAVIKFTQCCALEFAEYGIRVNSVAPGLTYTDMNKQIFLRDEGSQENADKLWEEMAKRNPTGRVGLPQDMANAVSFLASENASYINGETIGVNGGSNLG